MNFTRQDLYKILIIIFFAGFFGSQTHTMHRAQALLEQLAPSVQSQKIPMKFTYQHIKVNAADQVIMACRGEEIAGYVAYQFIGNGLHEVYINILSVKPPFRFYGVGKVLVMQVLNSLRNSLTMTGQKVVVNFCAESIDAGVSAEQLIQLYSRYGALITKQYESGPALMALTIQK